MLAGTDEFTGPENTHHWGKYHCMAGLKFNKTVLDRNKYFFLFESSEAVESKLVKLETSVSSPNSECCLTGLRRPSMAANCYIVCDWKILLTAVAVMCHFYVRRVAIGVIELAEVHVRHVVRAANWSLRVRADLVTYFQ